MHHPQVFMVSLPSYTQKIHIKTCQAHLVLFYNTYTCLNVDIVDITYIQFTDKCTQYLAVIL